MSEEMAVSDNTTGDEPLNNDEAVSSTAAESEEVSPELPSEPAAPEPENAPVEASTEETAAIPEPLPDPEVKEEPYSSDHELPPEPEDIKTDIDIKEEFIAPSETDEEDDKRGIKRRASVAFSDTGDEDFKGFDDIKQEIQAQEYQRILERLEAEVTAASKDCVPIRTVMATPPAPTRASKRARQDTDGSRPSSALSSRSDSEGVGEGSGSSPARRGGRRATAEMSSPLLRAPLERGWRRELVFRAALDAHSRRNADIYYYSPQGKKLRSTREVSEHLAGTGLTIENFSFFKEPLGVDDPEKEIIRDAKLMRRVESPSPAPVETKRPPRPKPARPASPAPAEPAPGKSPPAKLRVKSVGSRLSNNNASTPSPAPAPSTPTTKQKKAPVQSTTPSADNNNTASWKKPRPQPPPPAARPAPATPAPAPAPPASPGSSPLQQGRQLVQPCSMSCGRGAVPSLSCAACLCLYHPGCAGHAVVSPPDPFFCKNCRKSPTPVAEPVPIAHKPGGGPRRGAPQLINPQPHAHAQREKRVMLRMKVAGGTADGERVWAVAGAPPAPPAPPAPAPPAPAPQPAGRARAAAGSLPQSLGVLNGRRFIVVPRSVVGPPAHEDNKRVRRVANGAAPPPSVSPRRRGARPRADDTDHFTAFYNKAQENNYNVVVQIFQYLGMRDLAHCATVCKLWRQLASTPALWRHVRMKNSHVSDWQGLCAALKRHGTKRLDLRKMLLPQNDTVFWEQFAQHISNVDTLERIEMCRCPARAVEALCTALPGLRALSALAIRDGRLDPAPLGALAQLHELRLKSMAGLSLARDLRDLAALTKLQHLSLTSIKELGWCACDVIGSLPALESLELGECTFRAEFAGVLARLSRLRRLRLERGTPHCAAPDILRALATLPLLTRLELVNIDVKPGFDDALAACRNVQRLLIIPTYVSQSATTNKQVLGGVLRLRDSLTHLVWGVTIELLRVTELFIDQCEQAGEAKKRDVGECIPVLKPVPGCRGPAPAAPGPPQVEILPLPTLQRLLAQQLPHTKLKLLRIPFHATWRQSLADFQ